MCTALCITPSLWKLSSRRNSVRGVVGLVQHCANVKTSQDIVQQFPVFFSGCSWVIHRAYCLHLSPIFRHQALHGRPSWAWCQHSLSRFDQPSYLIACRASQAPSENGSNNMTCYGLQSASTGGLGETTPQELEFPTLVGCCRSPVESLLGFKPKLSTKVIVQHCYELQELQVPFQVGRLQYVMATQPLQQDVQSLSFAREYSAMVFLELKLSIKAFSLRINCLRSTVLDGIGSQVPYSKWMSQWTFQFGYFLEP